MNFSKLKAWKQRALIMYFLEDKSYKDIAETLNVPYDTVYGNIQRLGKLFTKDQLELLRPEPTIFVIGDTQCKPSESLEYMKWIGHYIAQNQPDIIVHIGDHYDMASLSVYDKGKLSAEGKRFHEDIKAGDDGLKIIDEYIKSVKGYNPRKVVTIGNHECLEPSTEVLTRTGFKNITEVTTDDAVGSYALDGTLVWHNPVSLIKKEYNDDLLVWDNQSFHTSVTKKHRMYYTTSSGKLCVREAQDMPSNFNAITAFKNSNLDFDISDNLLALSAWCATDSYFDKSGKYCTLYQREPNAHKISTLLEELGINYKLTVRHRNITEICGTKLLTEPEASYEFRFNAKHVPVSTNKELPNWVQHLSQRQWEIFLDTLIDADGSIPTGAVNSRVLYGAKRMCDSVQFHAIQFGWTASLTEYRPNQWRVNLVRRLTRRQCVSEPTAVPYSGDVYCLEMPLENFVVRSNNKVHVTGNCRIIRWVDEHPEFAGQIGYNLLGFEKYGWEVYDYLRPVKIHGINFVHYLANPMSGKPLGGSAKSRLAKFRQSYVMGHQQMLDMCLEPMPLDPERMQIGIVVGACYPFDEAYKGAQGNNHFRGGVMLYECADGSALPKPVSLKHMQKKYMESLA